jgi:hypothetical protein
MRTDPRLRWRLFSSDLMMPSLPIHDGPAPSNGAGIHTIGMAIMAAGIPPGTGGKRKIVISHDVTIDTAVDGIVVLLPPSTTSRGEHAPPTSLLLPLDQECHINRSLTDSSHAPAHPMSSTTLAHAPHHPTSLVSWIIAPTCQTDPLGGYWLLAPQMQMPPTPPLSVGATTSGCSRKSLLIL